MHMAGDRNDILGQYTTRKALQEHVSLILIFRMSSTKLHWLHEAPAWTLARSDCLRLDTMR